MMPSARLPASTVSREGSDALTVIPAQVPALGWDYEASVARVRQHIYRWRDMTAELAAELLLARERLSTGGRARKGERTWADYCRDIGSKKNTVNGWIRKISGEKSPLSRLIQQKLANLEAVLARGVIVGSVWQIGARDNYAGDPNFHGNSPTQIVEQFLLRCTEEGDTVIDPMAGSGTTIDVARALNRESIAFDLNPCRPDIQQWDATEPWPCGEGEAIFLHPPYWSLVRYSQDERDFSAMEYPDFVTKMGSVFDHAFRALALDGWFCLLIGDLVRDGRFYPVAHDLTALMSASAFVPWGEAIKLTANSSSTVEKGKMTYAEVAWTQNLRIEHDYVQFWRKK